MDQPPLVHVPLQHVNMKGPVAIVHDLFGDRLPDARPRHLEDALPPVEQAEVVPEVEIARLQDERQLVVVAAHDLLEAPVREPGPGVLAVGRQQRARQVRVPARALELAREARVRGQGRVDGGLVEGVAVEAGDAADGHGGVVQVVVEIGELLPKVCEGGLDGDPGVFALSFQAVEALDLVGGVVEGVVGMREEQLGGVVVGYAHCPFGVFAVGGDVEGLIGAANGVDEDTSKEAFEHESVDVIPVVSLVLEIRRRKMDDFDDSKRGWVQQLIQHLEMKVIGTIFLFRSLGENVPVRDLRDLQCVEHPPFRNWLLLGRRVRALRSRDQWGHYS